jgi:hypothetical protein
MTATDNSQSSNATFTPALTHTMNYSADAMRALANARANMPRSFQSGWRKILPCRHGWPSASRQWR